MGTDPERFGAEHKPRGFYSLSGLKISSIPASKMRKLKAMTTRLFQILPALFALLLIHGEADARAFRVAQIPHGSVDNCGACHVSQFSGGPRNAFGTEIEQNFLSPPGGAFGSVVWGPALASLDSDGDGVNNGTELNDPDGSWQAGSPSPGDPNDVTNPGVVDTSPPTPVPALSVLGLGLLMSALLGLALWKIRELHPASR